MPKCIQCGKPCGTEQSFNWNNGVAYLCSDKCEKESRSWRMAKYKDEEWYKNMLKREQGEDLTLDELEDLVSPD